MLTDKQFADWAQSSTKFPALLVEMSHRDGTVYLSNNMYFTGPNETPANISYDVCLYQEVLIERTLDQDSVGALRIFNDGSLDAWLDLFWEGYTIEIFIGDKSWNREDFRRQYKGNIESFVRLDSGSYEVKSSIATSVVETSINNTYEPWFFGDATFTQPVYVTQTFGLKRFRIAGVADYDKADVLVYYNGNLTPHVWIDDGYGTNQFYLDDYQSADPTLVRFSCPSLAGNKFKDLFTAICAYVSQPINAANLAAYPIDPDVTFYITQAMLFPDFLTLTLDTIGALPWINDAGELELYRKELPDLAGNEDRVTSWITPSDEPIIKTITTEYPASLVRTANPDFNHLSGAGPLRYSYNTLDADYPYKAIVNQSYAEDSFCITEGRRYADLLSVTRRTHSIAINRTSPELFVGAIVNIYSPKDRWNNNGAGLNALVVGTGQKYKSNKSELIVWR
jgi:hypothetical protein